MQYGMGIDTVNGWLYSGVGSLGNLGIYRWTLDGSCQQSISFGGQATSQVNWYGFASDNNKVQCVVLRCDADQHSIAATLDCKQLLHSHNLVRTP